MKSTKSYQLLEKPEETPSLWEAFAGNGCLRPSSRCVKELRSTCTAPIGGSVMEVYPSPSRPNSISISCFRWWSSRTSTTSYATPVMLFPQFDKRPVCMFARQACSPVRKRYTETFSRASPCLARPFATLALIHIQLESISSRRCSQFWVSIFTSPSHTFTFDFVQSTHFGRLKLSYSTWPRPTYHLLDLRSTMPPTLSFRRRPTPRGTT